MAKPTLKPEEPTSNWYKDRYQSVLVQRRLLVAITLASLVCTLAAVLVILSLIPQKTIEPYVIQVDQKSGITQYVNPVTAKELTADEAVKNFFIVGYIRAREGYSATNVVKQYEIVRIMSEPQVVYPAFRAQADANNSDSNVARLGRNGTRQVRIKSITYADPQVATVRVLFEESADGVNITAQQHAIITIKFEFTTIRLNAEERYVNPLGFRVLDYRVDEDAVP